MNAKIQLVQIPGFDKPIMCVVINGNGFTAYRRGGKEVYRVSTK